MSEVTDHNRQVAKFVANTLNVKPTVRGSTWKKFTSDVLIADNSPHAGVTTMATLGLSARNAVYRQVERAYGVELVTCHYQKDANYLDCVFDAAFLVLAHDEELYPGAVLPDVIGRRRVSSTMKHFFLIAPYLWDRRLNSFETDEREVRYLLAVPISDAEMALVGTEGSEALADLFDQEEIDIFDWDRQSVIDL